MAKDRFGTPRVLYPVARVKRPQQPGELTQESPPSVGPPPFDSRMELRAGEWEWRTIYYRGRHPLLDEADADARLYEAETGLTLLGDVLFLYRPDLVRLVIILRFTLPEAEWALLDQWLDAQADNTTRELEVEYFVGTHLKGWAGPPLWPGGGGSP